jgi:hypothetical protein
MGGQANYPTSLDDNTSLYDVVDGVTAITAAHHNNMKEAIKAIETKIGINLTTSATAIDYRLGSPTDSHRHDGAQDQGRSINPTTVLVPSGGHPSGLSLYDHLMSVGLHTATAIAGTGIASAIGNNVIFVPTQAAIVATGMASAYSPLGIFVPTLIATGIASAYAGNGIFVPTQVPRHIVPWYFQGSLANGASLGPPMAMGRTMQLESVAVRMRRAPSGATTAMDINIGPTSLWQASQGNRPIFAPGALSYDHASSNLVTYPSGALIAVDVDAVGSNDPGQDVSILFVFKE